MKGAMCDHDRELLRLLSGGCDVWSPAYARRLREMQKDPEFAGLFKIVPAMAAPSDGREAQPYFGAILTRKGKAAVAP